MIHPPPPHAPVASTRLDDTLYAPDRTAATTPTDSHLALVVAPVALLQAVRDELRPGARIVSVTSDAAVTPYLGWGAYGASKAALEQLSAVLAAELATTRPDLRVYWIDPGDIRTDMHQAAFPGEDISDRPPPETRVPAFVRLLEEDLPSGRYEASRLLATPRAAPEPRGVEREAGTEVAA